jgi:hypothetical protein
VNALRLVCLAVVCLMASGVFAQDRVDARMTGERVILVVPIVGAGTIDDPKRPLFAPKPGEDSPVDGFSWVPTDGGRLAIVVLRARQPEALQSALADARVQLAFQRGKHTRDQIETALRKLKRDFSLLQLLGGVQ